MSDKQLSKISREQQLQELQSRVTPIVNVDIVVFRRWNKDDKLVEPEFLIGRRNKESRPHGHNIKRLFPGGRMHYDEAPQDAALRILAKELPWVEAQIKKIVAAQSDKWYDKRAYGITLYYLFEYVSGEPEINDALDAFEWSNEAQMRSRADLYQLNVQLLPEIQATIRTMNSTQDELLVEVDKENNEIGTIEKRAAHNTNQRYHRAAHIMLFNTKWEVVLQKRSMNKASAPWKRDMPGWHHASGHTIEQTAQQELMEEMWVSTELNLERIWLKVTDTQAEYYYLYRGISDGPYWFDKNEVAAISSFDCEKLLSWFYDDEYDILDHVYEYTKELSHIRKK